MTRSSLFAASLVAALCLGGAAQAQVSLDLGDAVESATGTAESVLEGAADSTGSVGESVEGALGQTLPGADAAAAVLDHGGAIEAVKSRRALPLEQIIAKARLLTGGEIVDARLVSVRGFLLYELKVVEADGDVAELYFYAQSGEPVQTN